MTFSMAMLRNESDLEIYEKPFPTRRPERGQLDWKVGRNSIY